MTNFACDDCGEVFDRSEVVFSEATDDVVCLDCDVETREAEAEYWAARYGARRAVSHEANAYERTDPKHPEWAHSALDAADDRRKEMA